MIFNDLLRQITFIHFGASIPGCIAVIGVENGVFCRCQQARR
jgi:hypothetical protein